MRECVSVMVMRRPFSKFLFWPRDFGLSPAVSSAKWAEGLVCGCVKGQGTDGEGDNVEIYRSFVPLLALLQSSTNEELESPREKLIAVRFLITMTGDMIQWVTGLRECSVAQKDTSDRR